MLKSHNVSHSRHLNIVATGKYDNDGNLIPRVSCHILFIEFRGNFHEQDIGFIHSNLNLGTNSHEPIWHYYHGIHLYEQIQKQNKNHQRNNRKI